MQNPNVHCQVETQGKHRKTMEDRMIVGAEVWGRKFQMYAILDGHGGSGAAIFFQKRIPELLRDVKTNKLGDDITNAFRSADQEWYTRHEHDKSGTTFTGVLISREHVVTINVGDSRTIIKKHDNDIVATIDHNAKNATEVKRIKDNGGIVADGRLFRELAVLRALGDNSFKAAGMKDKSDRYAFLSALPDSKVYKREAISSIVIACDGLYDTKWTNDAIFKMVETNDCQSVINTASDLSKDNVSMIYLTKVSSPPPGTLKRPRPIADDVPPLPAMRREKPAVHWAHVIDLVDDDDDDVVPPPPRPAATTRPTMRIHAGEKAPPTVIPAMRPVHVIDDVMPPRPDAAGRPAMRIHAKEAPPADTNPQCCPKCKLYLKLPSFDFCCMTCRNTDGRDHGQSMFDGTHPPPCTAAAWGTRPAAVALGVAPKADGYPECRKLYGDKSICFYDVDKPYYEFTNFYASPVMMGLVQWPTTEHYFQASKFDNKHTQEFIRNLRTPREAFDYAQKNKHLVVKGWHDRQVNGRPMKVNVMKQALVEKFKVGSALRMLLDSTKGYTLVEHTRNDNYWGDGGGTPNIGKNVLGHLLMEIRDNKIYAASYF